MSVKDNKEIAKVNQEVLEQPKEQLTCESLLEQFNEFKKQLRAELDEMRSRLKYTDKPVQLSVLKPERTDRMPVGGAPVTRNDLNRR